MMKFAKGAIVAFLLAGAATPALANAPVDTQLYTDLLNYLQTSIAFEGAEFDALKGVIPAADLANLETKWTAVTGAEATLASYLSSQITAS